MLIQGEIRKTLQILFLLSIVPATLENVCGIPTKKNFFTFAADSVVYSKAEEQFCFKDKTLDIHKVYTEVGLNEESDILGSIDCGDVSDACFYAPESFEAIILVESSTSSDSETRMMVINEAAKRDYKEGNIHVKSRYLENEIECFHVSTSRENDVSDQLKSHTSFYFKNSIENLHCVIFNIGDDTMKKIQFDSKEVTIHFASEYVASLFKPDSNVPECESLNPTSVTFRKNIEKLTLDTQTHCIDGRIHELDLFKDVPNNKNKKNTECYINAERKKKSCLKLNPDVFNSGVLKTARTSKKTLLYHPNYSLHVTPIKFDDLKLEYSLNDRFCVNPYIYNSIHYMLRGYYNTKIRTHCFLAKEVAGTIEIKVKKDELTKTITFKGCPVDITKPIITNFPILLEDGENTFCLNKDYVFIDDLFSPTIPVINVFNLHDNCWIDFQAKRCYSIGRSTNYIILANKERTVNGFVSKKKATVNGQLSSNFLYQREYGKNHIICFSNSMVVKYDRLKEESYVNTDSEKLCISVSLMATSTTKNVEIDLQNSAGCPQRTLTLNPNNDKFDIDNLEVKECIPFLRYILDSEDVIKIFSNDLLEKCLMLTCSDVVWTLNLKSATSKNDILSTKVVICNDSPSTNCIDFSNSDLILYKSRNNMLNYNILVMTKEKLPNLIFDDYQRFYLPSYGKDDVVCFIKTEITGFVETNFKLKDNKYACAIVGELNSEVTIKLNNFADCQQEIKLLHNIAVVTDDKDIDPQRCIFLVKDEKPNTLKLKDEVINRCQPLTCSEVNHIVVTSDSIIRDTQKIIECSNAKKWKECYKDESKLTLFKIKNKFIPNGKFIHRGK